MKTKNNTATYQLLILVLFVFISCGSDDSEAPIEVNTDPHSIEIESESSYTDVMNETFQLSAIVKDVQGDILENQSIIWESNNTFIATISSDGLLRIISEGQIEITATVGNISESINIAISITTSTLIAFTANDLSNQLADLGISELLFLNESTMSGTYIELSVGGTLHNTNPNRDQVYYFFEGGGIMNVEGAEVIIENEMAVFVAANYNRSITSITSSTKIIRTELKLETPQNSNPFLKFTREQMEAPRNPNSNVWNPFLDQQTVIFGLYMLPQSIGGDSRLEHSFDEINIITRGSSLFHTDDGDIQVSPGSIVFVKEGNGHEFNNLESDHDILILWNK